MQIYAYRSNRSYKRSFGLRLLGPVLGFLVLIAPVYAQEVLRIPYVTDIGTFDPDNGFEVGAMSAINNVYEGLVEYEPGSTKVVGLCSAPRLKPLRRVLRGGRPMPRYRPPSSLIRSTATILQP